MLFRTVRTVMLLTTFFAMSMAMPIARGQPQPAPPLRLVVPFAAGGPADTIARELAQRLSPRLNRSVIVENRPGAGGAIGAVAVAKAAPDGNTLLATTSALVTTPALSSDAGYDPMKDFVPVSTSARAGFVVLASGQSRITTIAELVSQAKARQLSYGSSGTGTPIHLAAELIKRTLGISIAHVPYKGSANALTDLMGGHVDIAVDAVLTGFRAAGSGQAVAIAVTTEKRVPAAPNVPTIAELGYPGFEASAWYGLFAPTGTPATIVARLAEHTAAVVREPDFVAKLQALGAETYVVQGESLSRLVRNETVKWGDVIRGSGIKAN